MVIDGDAYTFDGFLFLDGYKHCWARVGTNAFWARVVKNLTRWIAGALSSTHTHIPYVLACVGHPFCFSTGGS